MLAISAGILADDSLRLVSWAGAAALVLVLARPSRGLVWVPAAAVLLTAVMFFYGGMPGSLWIWVAPLCVLGLDKVLSRQRLGRCLGALFGAACVAALFGFYSPPTALIASASLGVVWLLSLHRQSLLATRPTPQEARWLLPPTLLETDIQQEIKRSEREALHGEVVIFGCAHSTAADMEQLCRLLHDNLALYERAYRLNDFGVAVLLVTTDAQAAQQRREQLQHAIAPHRLTSSTPLQATADRGRGDRISSAAKGKETQSWH
ncbi:hypothetical protein [Salinicola rhizosphaerae]|uniref:hypothetical protein n=1 Tax=Salinicola rhizosphaerae TaxID=1443141 RepID=UPI0016782D21|nr:hypothetical protein [Salinicola rhizosphaerae]